MSSNEQPQISKASLTPSRRLPEESESPPPPPVVDTSSLRVEVPPKLKSHQSDMTNESNTAACDDDEEDDSFAMVPPHQQLQSSEGKMSTPSRKAPPPAQSATSALSTPALQAAAVAAAAYAQFDADVDDSVMGDWSLATSSDEDLDDLDGDGEEEKEHHPAHAAKGTANSTRVPRRRARRQSQEPQLMSAADIEICQRLDQEYEQALEEREIAYTARYSSVRQSACFSVFFMLTFLTLGTLFFLQQAEWTVGDSILFSIYTITTVGYGNLTQPTTPGFQMYVIFFIFVGIATLTIMVAQVYQCIALEASRAQHGRDKSMLSRKGLEILTRHGFGPPRASPNNNTANNDGTASTSGTSVDNGHHHEDMEIVQPHTWVDTTWQILERCGHFFTHNEIGKGISVLFPFLGLILIGAVVVGPIEGWTVVESLYFSVVSLTTVGFGDMHPTRTASIWFCILWLPFSIGFMSLFLAKVAAFYIRLSDKNIERIERHLRRQIFFMKERAERERQEARRRALRGQEHRDAVEAGEDADDEVDSIRRSSIELEEGGSRRRSTGLDSDDSGEIELGTGRRGKRGGFDTLPTEEDTSERGSSRRRSSRPLFGSKRSPTNRRELIMMNKDRAAAVLKEAAEAKRPRRRKRGGDNGASSSDEENRPVESTMTTMKHVLRTVHRQLAHEETSSDKFRLAGPESQFLSIRSSTTVTQALEQSSIRKPSFALRALVQERFAEIIATDIAGYSSNIEIHENKLSVTITALKQIADKWVVPRRARKAFRAVTFEALYFVGEHGLITRGADALYDLTPFEFHGLFSPLLAAMGDAETMEAWLSSTEVLAEVDLKRSYTAIRKAQADAAAASLRRRTQARESGASSQVSTTPAKAFPAADKSID